MRALDGCPCLAPLKPLQWRREKDGQKRRLSTAPAINGGRKGKAPCMVITRRAQKALSVIALVLIVALLVAQIVGAVGPGASSQPNLVNTGAGTGAVTIPQSCDLFRNGFYGSSLRLLLRQWQQTHPTEPVC